MNFTTETLFQSLQEKNLFDTSETEKAFYSVYDYMVGIAECDENLEMQDQIFNQLAGALNKERRNAFAVGMRAAFQLLGVPAQLETDIKA